MPIQLQANANNWNQVWFLSLPATTEPYPRQTCPILLTSPVIIALLDFPSGFHTGRYGGRLIQHINSGLVVGGGQDATVGEPRRCVVGEPQLHTFDIQGTYSLVFDLYTYIANAGTLIIWEYTGELN